MTGDVQQLIQEALDPVGWYEFIKPGGSTTHIAYVHEGGWVYLPEGPDVVTEEDFTLASASNRFWKLGRVKDLADELVSRLPKEVTTETELNDLPLDTVIRGARGPVWVVSDEVTDGRELRYIGAGVKDFYTGHMLLELHGPFVVLSAEKGEVVIHQEDGR